MKNEQMAAEVLFNLDLLLAGEEPEYTDMRQFYELNRIDQYKTGASQDHQDHLIDDYMEYDMVDDFITKKDTIPNYMPFQNMGTLKNSFDMYDLYAIKDDPTPQLDDIKDAFIRGEGHRAILRARMCAVFLREFREWCKEKNYNSYQTGQYFYNLIHSGKQLGGNAPERTSLLIYLLLSRPEFKQSSVATPSSIEKAPSLFSNIFRESKAKVSPVSMVSPPNVYRVLCRESRSGSDDDTHQVSRIIYHEFCIVGDLLGYKGTLNTKFHDFGYFLLNAVRHEDWNGNPPYAVDGMFNIACRLDEYEDCLARAIHKMSIEEPHRAFGKVLPLPRALQWGLNRYNKINNKPEEEKYLHGEFIRPLTFLNHVAGSDVVVLNVTKTSEERLNFTESSLNNKVYFI